LLATSSNDLKALLRNTPLLELHEILEDVKFRGEKWILKLYEPFIFKLIAIDQNVKPFPLSSSNIVPFMQFLAQDHNTGVLQVIMF
jgi:hypothetical protein